MNKPIERNNSMSSFNFEFSVLEAEEEDEEEIPNEIFWLLKHEERIIQPHEEPLETINLGTEENKTKKWASELYSTTMSRADW